MFKVGDKVKLKNPKQFSCGAKVLTIIKEVKVEDNKFIHVIYKGLKGKYFPVMPHEIEKVVTEGQQLLFSFMETV